jgi:hypothetical protein
MRHTRFRLLAPLAAVVAIAASPVALKDPVGVYGVLDRVVFEPDATNPERVQLWGVFALSNTVDVEDGKVTRVDVHSFHPAKAGYLYYMVNPRDAGASRADWNALARLAGTGEPVAFGGRMPPNGTIEPFRSVDQVEWAEIVMKYNGRVRDAAEALGAPDAFPLRMTPDVPLRARVGVAAVADVMREHAERQAAPGGSRP